jgi:hypothetical protein
MDVRGQSPYNRRAPTWSWLAVDDSVNFKASFSNYEKQATGYLTFFMWKFIISPGVMIEKLP